MQGNLILGNEVYAGDAASAGQYALLWYRREKTVTP